MTATTAFDATALSAFGSAYPNAPAKLTHGLVDHPLLRIDALVDLARRMPPEDVEYNRADLPIGIDPAAVPANGLGIEETIRSIEENGSWMVLKFVERDHAYKALLAETLAELEPVVAATTGPMLKQEGFIFVSSPGAVTPFHFDPEHNILLQIRGEKVMTVFPAHDEQVAPGSLHETFHLGGHRNLPWDDSFAVKGQALRLTPGKAIYVPVKAPHWVQNGPGLSISFSITWRSLWSYQEADAHGMNRLLRRMGINPARPRPFPDLNHGKSLTYRAVRRITGKS